MKFIIPSFLPNRLSSAALAFTLLAFPAWNGVAQEVSTPATSDAAKVRPQITLPKGTWQLELRLDGGGTPQIQKLIEEKVKPNEKFSHIGPDSILSLKGSLNPKNIETSWIAELDGILNTEEVLNEVKKNPKAEVEGDSLIKVKTKKKGELQHVIVSAPEEGLIRVTPPKIHEKNLGITDHRVLPEVKSKWFSLQANLEGVKLPKNDKQKVAQEYLAQIKNLNVEVIYLEGANNAVITSEFDNKDLALKASLLLSLLASEVKLPENQTLLDFIKIKSSDNLLIIDAVALDEEVDWAIDQVKKLVQKHFEKKSQ